jgi:hypothetical protein
VGVWSFRGVSGPACSPVSERWLHVILIDHWGEKEPSKASSVEQTKKKKKKTSISFRCVSSGRRGALWRLGDLIAMYKLLHQEHTTTTTRALQVKSIEEPPFSSKAKSTHGPMLGKQNPFFYTVRLYIVLIVSYTQLAGGLVVQVQGPTITVYTVYAVFWQEGHVRRELKQYHIKENHVQKRREKASVFWFHSTCLSSHYTTNKATVYYTI